MSSVVPDEHLCQFIHSFFVLNLNLFLYVCPSETALLYRAMIHVEDSLLNMERLVIVLSIGDCIYWAHSANIATTTIPAHTSSYWKDVFSSHLDFRSCLNSLVIQHGPLPPIKVFRNGLQLFYSKTKCGFDGLTEFRAVQRSSTSCPDWEQKSLDSNIQNFGRKCVSFIPF